MKKLLGIVSDIFLLNFLLIIFIIPLLVSFNLDPKLYNAGASNVAGVSTSRNNSENDFVIERNFSSSDRVFINDFTKENGKYSVNFHIAPGNQLDEHFSIGEIINNNSELVRVRAEVFSDRREIEDVFIYVRKGDLMYQLYDGDNYKEAELDINSNSNDEFQIVFTSDLAIKYFFDVELSLNTINY